MKKFTSIQTCDLDVQSENGAKTVPKYTIGVVAWYEQAIEKGLVDLELQFDSLVGESWRGGEREIAQTVVWYEQAVEKGHVD